MQRISDRVVRRFVARIAAKGEEVVQQYHLEGLFSGRPVTLYHGTTRIFRSFKLQQAREELVDKYYGSGVFLTPSKRIAEQYAHANRNVGFPPSLIQDLKRRNPGAGELMALLYEHGKDGWDIAMEPFRTEAGHLDMFAFSKHLELVDPNTVDDVAGYVIGSKIVPLGRDDTTLFGGTTGAPDHIYDALDELGLNSKAYRPKLYTVTVTVNNTLVTASQREARRAKARGYEAVVFHGKQLVGNVPEVAVYDPRNVKLRKIEVI